RHRPAHHLHLPAGVRRIRRPVRFRGRDLGLHLPDRGPGLRGRLPAYPPARGGLPVTPRPLPRRSRSSSPSNPTNRPGLVQDRRRGGWWWAEVGWRHAVALVAVAFALFPIL